MKDRFYPGQARIHVRRLSPIHCTGDNLRTFILEVDIICSKIYLYVSGPFTYEHKCSPTMMPGKHLSKFSITPYSRL